MADTDDALTYALAESLRVHLQDKMVDNVPSEFQAMLTYEDSEGTNRIFTPSLIKVGRFQDDPTVLSGNSLIPSSCISIHFNDPEDLGDGWKDTLASAMESSITNAGYKIPAVYQVGGGSMWWRRLRLEFVAFYIDANLSQSEAARLTAVMKHLIEHYANSASREHVHGWDSVYTAPLGETSLRSQVVKSHGWEGGGPDDDYLWKGGVWLQVLTEKQG